MGRKTFRREAWELLNKKSSTRGTAWWVPKVPSLISMLRRCFFLFILNAAVWAVEIVLIQGEDVFWSFALIDKLYTNIGTNPQDVSSLVVIATYGLIWGIGMFWVVGFFDRWFN